MRRPRLLLYSTRVAAAMRLEPRNLARQGRVIRQRSRFVRRCKRSCAAARYAVRCPTSGTHGTKGRVKRLATTGCRRWKGGAAVVGLQIRVLSLQMGATGRVTLSVTSTKIVPNKFPLASWEVTFVYFLGIVYLLSNSAGQRYGGPDSRFNW